MQVYVLLNDGFKAIIPKKAERNNLWQGRLSDRSLIVNQAGQYALFGGKVEYGEDARLAAIRELSEESGVDIRRYNYKVATLLETRYYKCLTFRFSKEEFQIIHENISTNLRTRNVYDGEMQSILVTRLSDVFMYLGTKQPISKSVQAEIDSEIRRNSKYKYNHAIDWYREIATECVKMSVYRPPKKKQSLASILEEVRQKKLAEDLSISKVQAVEELSIKSPISSPGASDSSSEHTTPEDVSDILSVRSSRKDSRSPDSLKSYTFETPSIDSPDESLRSSRRDSRSPDSLKSYTTPDTDSPDASSLKSYTFETLSTDSPDASLSPSRKDSRSSDSLKSYTFETPSTDLSDESLHFSRRDSRSPDGLKSHDSTTLDADSLDISSVVENLENKLRNVTPPPRVVRGTSSSNMPLTPSTGNRRGVPVSPSQNKYNIRSNNAEKMDTPPSRGKLSGSPTEIVSPKDRKIARENQENIIELPSISSLAEKLTRAGMESFPEGPREHIDQLSQNRVRRIDIKSIR